MKQDVVVTMDPSESAMQAELECVIPDFAGRRCPTPIKSGAVAPPL